MPVLWYCVAVRECSQHVIFIKGIDAGRVQVSFVKSLATSSPSIVHFIGALSGEIWGRKAHVFQLFPVQTIGFLDKIAAPYRATFVNLEMVVRTKQRLANAV